MNTRIQREAHVKRDQDSVERMHRKVTGQIQTPGALPIQTAGFLRLSSLIKDKILRGYDSADHILESGVGGSVLFVY